jgi:hypothetical protein
MRTRRLFDLLQVRKIQTCCLSDFHTVPEIYGKAISSRQVLGHLMGSGDGGRFGVGICWLMVGGGWRYPQVKVVVSIVCCDWMMVSWGCNTCHRYGLPCFGVPTLQTHRASLAPKLPEQFSQSLTWYLGQRLRDPCHWHASAPLGFLFIFNTSYGLSFG